MKPGSFIAKIDSTDAYYLVPIDDTSKKFLRFKANKALYEFTCLPFGLNTAPYVFTKLLKPVIASLREQGFQPVIYLDDILIFGNSYSDCLNIVDATKKLLIRLGFLINEQKISLIPSHRCLNLGMIYDLIQMTVELPNEKRAKINCLLSNLKRDKVIKIKKFAEILGYLNHGLLYTKACERLKYLSLLLNNNNYEGNSIISEEVYREICWWITRPLICCNPIREFKFDLEIYTDASLTGWGAVYEQKKVFGHWSYEEKSFHINYLGLLAVLCGLESFVKNRENCQILLHIDNTTAIAYINKMGGIQFENLNNITKEICDVR